MSHEVLIIWYPDGQAGVELCAESDAAPLVGDKLARRNAEWTVASVDAVADDAFSVIVMPARVSSNGNGSWPEPFEFISVP